VSTRPSAHRGRIVHFVGDALETFDDGLLVIADGRIVALGPTAALRPTLAPDVAIVEHRGKLIAPGFVDTHVHYAQTDIVGSHGEQLITWLERYAFPVEQRFADPAHAASVAEFFLDELARQGTTTAVVFGTVHAASVDALFAAAARRRMRLIAGKVLMDRNAPEALRDTAASGYEDSTRLIERWHGRGRLGYAVTPRFAPTSSPELRLAARLLDEHPGVLMQTHVAENRDEVRWVAELFPEARSYLDVYERCGLLRRGAILAHGIHLDRADVARVVATGAQVAHCPSSNLFIGSGLFPLRANVAAGMHVSIGTDVAGGTSFGMLPTLADAYKVSQLLGAPLAPTQGWYHATLGAARALGLDDRIGNLAPGKEADFIVIDPAATPLLARRTAGMRSIEEVLFTLAILGDDRAIAATYILGEPRKG
jgi:guanine deaminase